MNCRGAMYWIVAMNGARYLGVTGWRLPTIDLNGDPSVVDGSGGRVPECSDNEYRYLCWEDSVASPSFSSSLVNIQGAVYWSGTVYAPHFHDAWDSDFSLLSGGGEQTPTTTALRATCGPFVSATSLSQNPPPRDSQARGSSGHQMPAVERHRSSSRRQPTCTPQRADHL